MQFTYFIFSVNIFFFFIFRTCIIIKMNPKMKDFLAPQICVLQNFLLLIEIKVLKSLARSLIILFFFRTDEPICITF